jgi:lysophospholipase L1-like esterase
MKIASPLLAVALIAGTAHAQTPAPTPDYRSAPPRQPPIQANLEPRLAKYRADVGAKLLDDFGEQYIYAPADAALGDPKPGEQRVVFLGDSITDKWNLAAFFPGKSYINRGINGQVTPQMLVRFHADVVALKPAAVVILAGVNDINGVLQFETESEAEANYEAMAEIAVAHGIKPIFTEILPVSQYDQSRNVAVDRKPEGLAHLNAWLEAYCKAHGYTLIDYGPALRDDKGQLRADYSVDGLHPSAKGYAVMAPIAEKAIETTLAKP